MGFLFNTQEIVWRGVAVPRLQNRDGALIATLLIAIPEVILPLPSFWIHENPFYETLECLVFSVLPGCGGHLHVCFQSDDGQPHSRNADAYLAKCLVQSAFR